MSEQNSNLDAQSIAEAVISDPATALKTLVELGLVAKLLSWNVDNPADPALGRWSAFHVHPALANDVESHLPDWRWDHRYIFDPETQTSVRVGTEQHTPPQV